MKILLTNDDGFLAPGIRELATQLEKEGHELTIVAPEYENSGKSHSITFSDDIIVKKQKLEGINAPVFSVLGTPADCVRVAVEVTDGDFDFVFSGCNFGANAGIDVLYSGTVSAAIEASILGYPAIAVSAKWKDGDVNFETASRFAVEIFNQVKEAYIGKNIVININAPRLPYDQVKGIKVCKIGGTTKDYYFMNKDENSTEAITFEIKGKRQIQDEIGTDKYYLQEGYVSVTPLIYDLTNCGLIRELKEHIKE